MRASFPFDLARRICVIWTMTLAGPLVFAVISMYRYPGLAAPFPWICALLLLPGLLLAPVLSALGLAIAAAADAPERWGWGTFLGLGGAVLGLLAELGGLLALVALAGILGTDAQRSLFTALFGGAYALMLIPWLLVQPFVLAGGYFAGHATWRWAGRVRTEGR
jgi:hypothetical protein